METPPYHRITRWICAWATLFDGLAAVLTFGFWWPNWSFSATAWKALKDLRALNIKGVHVER